MTASIVIWMIEAVSSAPDVRDEDDPRRLLWLSYLLLPAPTAIVHARFVRPRFIRTHRRLAGRPLLRGVR